MKKFLLYSLVTIAALFMASCSSNDDKTLDGVPGTYSGRDLSATVNGTILSGSDIKVEVTGDDADHMTLIARNIILGQESYTINDVQVRVDKYDARVFVGSGDTDCNLVRISGKIAAGKMVLTVEQAGVTGDYTFQNQGSISVNGEQPAANAAIEIQGTKVSDLKMVLKNIVLGEDELEMQSVTVSKAQPNTPGTKIDIGELVEYNFTASYRDSYREISAAGLIGSDGMTVNVTVKNLGDMVGKWKIALVDDGSGTEIPSVLFEITGADGLTIMGMPTTGENGFPVWVAGLVGSLGSDYLKALQYIDFKADGNIALLVHDPLNNGAVIEIPNEMIPAGAIRWYMKDGQAFFVVEQAMIDMIPGGYGEIVKGFFPPKDGYLYVPLGFKKTTTGAVIYLDKEFLKKALPVIEANLPDEILIDPTDPESNIKPFVDMILGDIKNVLDNCTTFDVGLNLEKTE